MGHLDTEQLLIVICGLVVVSYLFSIMSRFIRVPSVLLLLFAGVLMRWLADTIGFQVTLPGKMVEVLGVAGLIMIILEAGLDLKLHRNKITLIRNSFLSAFFLLLLSTVLLTAILHYWLSEPLIKCLVYAIPLSIMSSSIVIPSIHSLSVAKKEFLVYEASFSDILGILLFNYFTASQILTWKSLGIFGGNIVLSIVLSILLSFLLFIVMAKTRLNIKFFLIFALLILIYSGGKILHLPSLIIILVFGLLINNWELIRWRFLRQYFPHHEVENLRKLLHSITAETSFLIRTFFFIFFGFTFQLDFFAELEIWKVGGLIVFALFIIRWLYLRFFLHTNVFPETFFIPRGLITIVLFYKIPENFKLHTFNEGILFFIIFTTSIIMTLGMIMYKKPAEEIVEERQFSERPDIL